ncbi:MAG: ferrochelatase [Mariprofundaceae bacterium]|nr:ferrochelatase [Mariprofundaceae bacterium]
MTSTAPIGVLLCNLGTPDAPDAPAVRRYLREFLWDKRVVDFPRPLWWLILNCAIVPLRSPKSAALYRKIWTDAGSPLLAISKQQQRALQTQLDTEQAGQFRVELAMRYGNPSITAGMQVLRDIGCARVLILPLYPQYSSSSSASTFDAVAEATKQHRDMPELRFVRDYHQDKAYIAALAATIRQDFACNGQPDKLMFSFHGIPKRFHQTGDPYPDECKRTAALLAAALELADDAWVICFQSRFGREEWLQPYTDKTLGKLAAEGVKNIAVACPGFAADCLETLEEINIQNRQSFLAAGGESFRYIPALNDHKKHIQALTGIITCHSSGWLDKT